MKSASLRVAKHSAALTALLLGFSSLAGAQIGGGSVVGTVTDPSGAAVAGAGLAIINVETNVKNTTTANDGGYYEFPLLQAGRYAIEAEASGFSKARIEAFTLNTGTRPRLDIKLGLKEVAEQVTVIGTASQVNATSTDLGVVIDQHKI